MDSCCVMAALPHLLGEKKSLDYIPGQIFCNIIINNCESNCRILVHHCPHYYMQFSYKKIILNITIYILHNYRMKRKYREPSRRQQLPGLYRLERCWMLIPFVWPAKAWLCAILSHRMLF